MDRLKGKKILIAITGGIAAYKTPELIRLFIKSGCDVRAAVTENAGRFVSRLALETVTGTPVLMDDFSLLSGSSIPHIEATAWCDILVIAPATGNIIGKTAAGIADDLVSTMLLAATGKPVLFAPAMNQRMYHNPAVQKNIGALREMGCHFIGPDEGEMARLREEKLCSIMRAALDEAHRLGYNSDEIVATFQRELARWLQEHNRQAKEA